MRASASTLYDYDCVRIVVARRRLRARAPRETETGRVFFARCNNRTNVLFFLIRSLSPASRFYSCMMSNFSNDAFIAAARAVSLSSSSSIGPSRNHASTLAAIASLASTTLF